MFLRLVVNTFSKYSCERASLFAIRKKNIGTKVQRLYGVHGHLFSGTLSNWIVVYVISGWFELAIMAAFGGKESFLVVIILFMDHLLYYVCARCWI